MDQHNIDDIPTAIEIAGAVTAQHGMIRAAFHAAKTGSEEDQEVATELLLRLLAMHEAAEQLTVHPSLAHAGGGPVGVGDDRMAEERQTVQLVERLQELDRGSYEYNMQLALLEEAVTHHATAEEASELPLFADLGAPSD
ncbi:hemerythrin domain-containing protein [Flexivirga alba]|uniref:Hemerythrin domain-containing protein n=1 Tax=Flexivirga alba TaxID=702742 RepID=A0ABW2AJK9_9MICO